MLKKNFIKLSTLVLFFSQLSWASKIGSKNISWGVLNTKHFSIIYNKNQQDLGLYYSRISEQAYSNLKTVFKSLPEKISLVINDSTDTSNGNATVFPYPLINVYSVQIGQQETLSESGEWARELVTHELTHIAQMYPYSGSGYQITRDIFGSIISPNLLTPNWWKEGMAVELETQFSHRGRTRSKMQDAQVRAYVQNGTFKNYDLAQANENLITWPYGNRPYFFGSLIMNEISTTSGLQGIGKLVENQSYELPYFINDPVLDVTHLEYADLYNKMLVRYQQNAETQIKTLQQVPTSEVKYINDKLIQSRSIKYQSQNQLIGQISTNDFKTQFEFYSFNKQDNMWTPLDLKKLPSGSIGNFSFHPTEKKIIYSKSHSLSSTENYSDLYTYDLQSEKSTPLTKGKRARDPVYSPDGKTALFAQTNNGQTQLSIIDIATQKIQSIVLFGFENRLTSYTYLSENEFLYTVRNAKGEQFLFSKKINTAPLLVKNAPTDINYLNYKKPYLYFNSGVSGVTNVYQATVQNDQLTMMKPVSHFLTGALSFDINSNPAEVFATLITDHGLATTVSPFTKLETLPQIENKTIQNYSGPKDQLFDSSVKKDDYSSFSYLIPKYWIPFISTNNTNDGVLFQAMTSSSDPLLNHAYMVQANYDTAARKLGYAFNYRNSQLFWDWSIEASEHQQLLTIDNYVKKNNLIFSVYPDVFFISEDLNLSFGATLFKTEDDQTKFQTEHLGSFIQGIYSTTDQKSYQYYPMSGITLGAKISYFKDLKNQVNPKYGSYSQGLFSLAAYESSFLPKNHNLVFKLSGLYTPEDVALRFGASSLSLPGESGLSNPYNIRGYQAAQFLGSQLFTTSLEYRFPVVDITSGGATLPFYTKYLTGAIVADALTAKGYGYNLNEAYEAIDLKEQIFSAGVEARLSTTIGYLLPVNFIAGVYAPFSKKWAKDPVVLGLNIQASIF